MTPFLLGLIACGGPDRPSDAAPTPDPSLSTADSSGAPVALVGEAPLQFRGARPRNVLMISIDTFRRDHIDPYGDLGLIPTITDHIERGVSASDAMQCSNWTMASTSCTLLGEDHVERGFLPKLDAETREPYPDGTRFLATELSDAGWHTVLSSRNGFLSLDADVNNAQGYDHLLDDLRPASGQLTGGLAYVASLPPDTPWMLHLHMTEPHSPYDPPEHYYADAVAGLPPIAYDLTDAGQVSDLRRAIERRELDDDTVAVAMQWFAAHYQAEVRYLNDQLAEGLAEAEAAGLLDDTLVVWWTDHGEQAVEHGEFTHAYQLYGEENDALFALWSPTIVPAVIDGPVHLIDLAPTVMTALGLTPPERMSGYPLGQAPADRSRFAVAVARGEGRTVLRKGDLKMHFTWSSGQRELYDLSVDPGETDDRFDEGDPLSVEMWAELRDYTEAAALTAPEMPISWPDPT
jgi:arylsulfatase A-like enzyme